MESAVISCSSEDTWANVGEVGLMRKEYMQEILAVAHADAQAAYGATILSFLGAIHWGLAMADYAG